MKAMKRAGTIVISVILSECRKYSWIHATGCRDRFYETDIRIRRSDFY